MILVHFRNPWTTSIRAIASYDALCADLKPGLRRLAAKVGSRRSALGLVRFPLPPAACPRAAGQW